MTPMLSCTDLAIANRLSALVCSKGWKGELDTVIGYQIWLVNHGPETHQLIEDLGPVDNWGAVMDWVEAQRRNWWRLMGMASRGLAFAEEDRA